MISSEARYCFLCCRRGSRTFGGIRVWHSATGAFYLKGNLITQRDLDQIAAQLIAIVMLIRLCKTQIVTEINNKIAELV